MQRFRFPLAVAVTSLALVAIVIGAGGLLVGNALAVSPFSGHDGWQNASLPPELAGLASVPAADRFAHFRGVRVQLTDKDNNPLTLQVTPGTATTVSATSLTITANDGSSHTFTLDDKTMVRGTSAPIAQNEKVLVATLDNSTTATAVVAFNPDGFGPRGPWGPWGH
jgi:hypothetical protein